MIRIGTGLRAATYAQLLACGRSVRECVVYWLATLDRPDVVASVIHPVHSASRFSYDVDDAWLTRFSFELGEHRHTAIAQVHTHPGNWLGHSESDDRYPLVPSPGFMSIVVGDPAEADNAWQVHVLNPDGTWTIDPGAVVA